MTTGGWSAAQLRSIGESPEIEIAAQHADGRPAPPVPIWAVVVDEQVYVRTWHRRDSGWYGRAVRSGRARTGRAGASVDVIVDQVDTPSTRSAVDAAYRAKYGAGAESMTTDEAAASTLRLTPV